MPRTQKQQVTSFSLFFSELCRISSFICFELRVSYAHTEKSPISSPPKSTQDVFNTRRNASGCGYAARLSRWHPCSLLGQAPSKQLRHLLGGTGEFRCQKSGTAALGLLSLLRLSSYSGTMAVPGQVNVIIPTKIIPVKTLQHYVHFNYYDHGSFINMQWILWKAGHILGGPSWEGD